MRHIHRCDAHPKTQVRYQTRWWSETDSNRWSLSRVSRFNVVAKASAHEGAAAGLDPVSPPALLTDIVLLGIRLLRVQP